MKIENEWLDMESMEISKEQKIRRGHTTRDTIVMLKIMFMLSCIFFYASPSEALNIPVNVAKNVEGGGQMFRCPTCRTNQWHASSTKDWQGNYYCSGCKAKLN